MLGAVAQLGERLVCNQEATGSIPVSSTKSLSGVMARRLITVAKKLTRVGPPGVRCALVRCVLGDPPLWSFLRIASHRER
jgi:hypothetical protein